MGVSWGLVRSEGEDIGAWSALSTRGPFHSFALLVDARGSGLRVVRSGFRRGGAPASVHRWSPTRLPSRVAGLRADDVSRDLLEQCFDGFDLFAPLAREGGVFDLRPFGLPYQRATTLEVLFTTLRARADDPDAADFVAQGLVAARLCAKYGTLLSFCY